jgi:PPK2 family polyphosphate:nucleotide phosphotransferase
LPPSAASAIVRFMPNHIVKPGTKVRLKDYDPEDTGPYKHKEDAQKKLAADVEKLSVLQDRLYAENRRALLVVLQAMDAGGKDGTVKHVFSGVNPAGCTVTSFKVPSDEEVDHDFLWRVYKAVPRRGDIGIFNRSHYEDVLVVRVHKLVPKEDWSRRFDMINRFEELLVENGTTILKFFLHISKDEQKKRILARLDDPDKNWKYTEADARERKLWDKYQEAYEDALTQCSTKHAPWIIVPANSKWYKNLVVADTIVKTLEEMDPRPPKASIDVGKAKGEID